MGLHPPHGWTNDKWVVYRFNACYFLDRQNYNIESVIIYSQCMLYLIMMMYAICKYHSKIVGLNRWLLVSWTVESFWTSVNAILYDLDKAEKYDQLRIKYINFLL